MRTKWLLQRNRRLKLEATLPSMADIVIHTDGGARGNPGPAAIGAVIQEDNVVIAQVSSYIGEQTNNWAEYEALIRALEEAKEALGERLKDLSVEVRMDSELIVRQIEGIYKVKEPSLKEQHARARELLDKYMPNVKFTHVPREENKEADRLVNEALDAQQ